VRQGVDVQDFSNHVVDNIMHLHETVRQRLLNPQTPVEKAVAESGVQAWVQPMQRPDVGRIITELNLVRPDTQPAAAGELAEAFTAQAQQNPDFVFQLPVKPVRQVLAEMKEEFVGFGDEQKAAQRLAFRQSYDKARAGENLAPLPAQSFNTVYTGNSGIGKSSFAHKQAELLVALGLADPLMVELTHENHGKMAGTYSPKQMTEYFINADIISVEMTGGKYFKDGKNVDDYVMDSLQAALDARKKPLTLFLSGRPEDVEAALDNCPGVKGLMKNYIAVPDPSIDQLGAALVHRLAHPLKDGVEQKDGQGLVIDKAALDYVKQEFVDARKRLGWTGFRNMREVDAVAEKLPDAIAERLFGSDENEQALTSSPDRKAVLNTVTLDDVKAINMRKFLGGPAAMERPGIGFTANL
jgi:hypothetical protein